MSRIYVSYVPKVVCDPWNDKMKSSVDQAMQNFKQRRYVDKQYCKKRSLTEVKQRVGHSRSGNEPSSFLSVSFVHKM